MGSRLCLTFIDIMVQQASQWLIDEIKQMQRCDWMAKIQWWAYCDEWSEEGSYDPAPHTDEFIKGFFDWYAAGNRLTPKPGSGRGNPRRNRNDWNNQTEWDRVSVGCQECKDMTCWIHCGMDWKGWGKSSLRSKPYCPPADNDRR